MKLIIRITLGLVCLVLIFLLYKISPIVMACSNTQAFETTVLNIYNTSLDKTEYNKTFPKATIVSDMELNNPTSKNVDFKIYINPFRIVVYGLGTGNMKSEEYDFSGKLVTTCEEAEWNPLNNVPFKSCSPYGKATEFKEFTETINKYCK